MKLTCAIDGKHLSLNVNSQKSLLNILIDDYDIDYLKTKSRSGKDNNCLVMIDSVPYISALVPAFSIKGKHIATFEGFKKTSSYYKMIERVYDTTNIIPCPHCYESKTLILSYLARKYKNVNRMLDENDSIFIQREFSLVNCKCLDPSELNTLVKKATQEFRRNRV